MSAMGAGLAVRVKDASPLLGQILAVEMAYIIQAVAIRKELDHIPSRAPVSEEVKEKLAEVQSELKDLKIPLTLNLQISEQYPVNKSQRKLNVLGEKILKKVSKIFPPIKEDTALSDRLQALADVISAGEIVEMACSDISFD